MFVLWLGVGAPLGIALIPGVHVSNSLIGNAIIYLTVVMLTLWIPLAVFFLVAGLRGHRANLILSALTLLVGLLTLAIAVSYVPVPR